MQILPNSEPVITVLRAINSFNNYVINILITNWGSQNNKNVFAPAQSPLPVMVEAA